MKLAQFSHRFFLTVFAICMIPVLFVILSVWLQVVGVYISEPGWKVAEIAAEKQKPEHCGRIFVMPWNIFSPPTVEQRELCRYTYAKLTKDPTACEPLMPSDYGWSCLGVAREKEPCFFNFADTPEVRGNGIIVPMSDCKQGSEEVQANMCCVMARTVFLDETYDCSLFDNPAFRDQCLHRVARKLRRTDQCALIGNTNIRSACEVAVKALQTGSK